MATDVPDAEILQSENALDAIEQYFRNGWTDGLPVVPPQEEAVRRLLAAVNLEGDSVLCVVPERDIGVTARLAAINAVMAGCLPVHFTVVVAVLRAVANPDFRFHATMTSTSGAGHFIVVNGPVRKTGKFASGIGALGPGYRANLTVGRTLRLVIQNVFGAAPGPLNRSCLGHPGQLSLCVAEDEEASPWKPLSVQHGVSSGTSAVSVYATEAPRHVRNDDATRPEELLDSFARTLVGRTSVTGHSVAVINPEHREVLSSAGWSRREVESYITRRVAEIEKDLSGEYSSDLKSAPESSSSFHVEVIAAGGAGQFSAVVPAWAGGDLSVPARRALARTAPETTR